MPTNLPDFEVSGQNDAALFTLKVRRGEGMVLLSMNWKTGRPTTDFVGFSIETKEPGEASFFSLPNRIAFPAPGGAVNPHTLSTRVSPIQKFRWVHFPRNVEINGLFTYQVTPVFMNDEDTLSYGEHQVVTIELGGETYPGQVNVAFTRGFVASQAFTDRFQPFGDISTLLPPGPDDTVNFVPTHPKADEALPWMGFEARKAVLDLLDAAIADTTAEVRVVAYDLSLPEFVSRLEQLGPRLKIIIDDSTQSKKDKNTGVVTVSGHGAPDAGETTAENRLKISAGVDNVKRQHMGALQHNKSIIVNGASVKAAIGGSTNYSWRGFYVQNNNALLVRGETAVKVFMTAFDSYWESDKPVDFGKSPAAKFNDLGLSGINAKVAFSPHNADTALLKTIADDIGSVTSNLFYSLAFLAQTPGPILDAITKVTSNENIFVFGIADKKVKGFDLLKPDGNFAPVRPSTLSKNIPEPFKSEQSGGSGIRLHHKFVVLDFEKPSARVYLGSYNFSSSADVSNGENLFLIQDRRIVVSYLIEAIRLFDHYHFRVAVEEAKKAGEKLELRKPPRKSGEVAWWEEDYSIPEKIRDRELFA
jgi:phosphatidylserine/phosphatidylglycerophosphate/cardiolipin synthase-like enzyme